LPIDAFGGLMQNITYNILIMGGTSDANRIEVKQAVEKILGVKVKSVQVMNRKGKVKRRGLIAGRTSSSRRAIVRLQEGQTINLI